MEHINIPAGEIHAPHNWEFADSAAREAADIDNAPLVGRIALQQDDGTYWRLSGVAPTTWVAIVDWETLPGKPVTFPPSEHTHSWPSITEKPTEFPPSEHTHSLSSLGVGPQVGIIPNVGTVSNRNVTCLGDSVSAGAFALNSFVHAWPRIFSRALNVETGGTSYGFAGLLTLGSAGTTTTEIHSVSFSGGSWVGIDSATNAAAQNYPTGAAMRASDETSQISITVPSFQGKARIYYGKRPGGISFTISVKSVVVATVSTDGIEGYGVEEVTMVDNGYGNTAIIIKSTAAGAVQPEIIGIAYVSATPEPVFNNFSQSGRRLRYLGEDMIEAIMAESGTVIIALGLNDYGSADSDDEYYTAFMERISWLTTHANANGVRIVVPDFCWSAAETSRTRLALQKLAQDTGGTYINLPAEIFKGRESIPAGAARATYLVSTLQMWTDGTHPGKGGHKWIAETILKRLGFSCTSKHAAITQHDWWMPLQMVSGAGTPYNSLVIPNVSAVRRSGNLLMIKLFLERATSGSFAVGTYTIQTAWPTKYEMAAFQGYSGVGVIRSDTGAVVSTLSVSAGGQITLKVLDGTWINDQDMTFVMPT